MSRPQDVRFTFSSTADITFEVVSFELTEGISELFCLNVELISESTNADFATLLDKPATLTLFQGGQPVRYVHGLISQFEQGKTGFRRTWYRARIEPELARANLLLANNPTCKLQWFYDAAGNNTREHQHLHLHLYKPCHVAIWQHEYDALNQRIATTRPDGHRVSWLTYGSGHLLAMKVDDIELLSYQRDDLHREIARHQGNNLQQRQSWTPNGQLQEQTVALTSSSTRLLVRNYRYDDAGQLTDLHDNRRGDINYRYDPLGRLLSATTLKGEETFAFDPASTTPTTPAATCLNASTTAKKPVSPGTSTTV